MMRRHRAPATPPHIAAVAQTAFDHAVLRVYALPTEGERNVALAALVNALSRLDGHPAEHAA